MDLDNESSLQAARLRLPLKQLIEQHGFGPKDGRWNAYRCPFCQKKGKASVFTGDSGTDLFKCFANSCPTGSHVMDEVGFVAHVSNLNRKEAFVVYLKQAHVWMEREKFSAPEGKARKTKAAAPPDDVRMSRATTSASLEGTSVQTSLDPGGSDGSTPTHTSSPTESSLGKNDADNLSEAQPDEAEARINQPAEPSRPILDDGTGLGVVRAFYKKLSLTPEDEKLISRKRGLTSKTIAALGFRSNGKANEPLLQALMAEAERYDLLASGLFMRTKNSTELKINKQFCGWGLKGKKPGISQDMLDVDSEAEEPDQEEWEWGWTQPILIPFFNWQGELIGLRPHKGMGRRGTLVGTPRLYVPRDPRVAGPKEYCNVVLTEGEFKAAALWDVVGAGRQDRSKPWGVAALPGISFARHFEIREQLDQYLRRVRARRVLVFFDNEEKGDPALPGYKADYRKRHDAQIYARVLAIDLSHEMPVRCEVGMIPNKWRDDKGKADWDGMLCQIAATEWA